MNTETRMAYNGTRVLVLGASGFIGRWVARRLQEAGADLFLGVRNRRLLEGGFPVGRIMEVDLLAPDKLVDLVTQCAPAVVFNLAGYGINPAERDESQARRINTDLLSQLVEAMEQIPAGRWQGQRIVHTGSALEYGVCDGDLSEETRAEPTTLYGRTKLAGTLALQARAGSAGLAAVTARLFTVYGPGERAGRLMPSLLEAARSGEPLPLTAGMQCRDFTYVEDVVEGLLRLGWHSRVAGGIVNLATGQLTTVRQFIEIAARVLAIPADHLQFGVLPQRQEEMAHKPVSIRKLQALTGWTPQTGIEQGVRQTALQMAVGQQCKSL